MKRHIKYLAIIAIMLAVIPIGQIVIERSYIHELNQNLEVDDLQFLTPIESNKEEDNSNYIEYGGWGGRFFSQSDGKYRIVYSGFPDVIDTYKLTDIHIMFGDYSVFNIIIGSSADEVYEIMNSFGYKEAVHGPEFSGSSGANYYFRKGKIGITFYLCEDNSIESILIRLKSTNKDNIDF